MISARPPAFLHTSAQAFWLPKGGNSLDEYEDAFAFGTGLRTVAIADGASDSYDAGRWARLLVDSFTDVPPAAHAAALREWVDDLARVWRDGLDFAALPWNHQEKARLGAHCTFLGVEFAVEEPSALAPATPCGRWRAIAVGDSCLFRRRDGVLDLAFPLSACCQFDSTPALLATNAGYRGAGLDKLAIQEGELRLGDTFILATDALARRLLHEQERGADPWEVLQLDPARFAVSVEQWRRSRQIRNDDVTLLLLQVGAEPTVSANNAAAIVRKRESDLWLHG